MLVASSGVYPSFGAAEWRELNDTMGPSTGPRWRYRLAFGLIAALLLLTAVLLPLAVTSVVGILLEAPEGELSVISTIPHSEAPPTHTDLILHIVALDEVRGQATLEVQGYHICEPACEWSDQVRLFSIWDPTAYEASMRLEGLPPSVSIVLPPSRYGTTQTVQLPLHGQPVLYPFDSYELRLGIALERLHPDGTTEQLPVDEARGHLFVAIQPLLGQEVLDPPVPLATVQRASHGAPVEYVYATRLVFHRLLYLPVLAVLLVLLVAAAALYAVFLRPFQDLLLNVGGLILGIWGIRSILTPSSVTSITALDLSLSVVILFLLGAITVRALFYVRERGAAKPPTDWS